MFLIFVIIIYITSFNCRSYQFSPSFNRLSSYNINMYNKHLNAVPDWLTTDEDTRNDIIPMVTVRFINTVDGNDVIAHVPMGSNLLATGDGVGVKLPRACRTGLCGSCTCDVQDPNAIATKTNPRDGFATIRACSAKCSVPEGMTEMVVDVHRMRKTATAAARRRAGQQVSPDDYVSLGHMRYIHSIHFDAAVTFAT